MPVEKAGSEVLASSSNRGWAPVPLEEEEEEDDEPRAEAQMSQPSPHASAGAAHSLPPVPPPQAPPDLVLGMRRDLSPVQLALHARTSWRSQRPPEQ